MIEELMHDPIFLAGKSEVVTKEDLQTRIKTYICRTAHIIQHEIDHCNGGLL